MALATPPHLPNGDPVTPRPQSALETLSELHQVSTPSVRHGVRATGFVPLDDVLSGGIRPGELLVVGGKPAVGKTIVCLQWARTMAREGITAVYVCYEHDHATLLSRLLACELGELAASSGRHVEFELEELQGRLRDVACGALTLQDAVDSDALLHEAENRLSVYADRLMLFPASGSQTDLATISDTMARHSDDAAALFVDYVQKVPVRPEPASDEDRVARAVQGLKAIALEHEVPVIAIASAHADGLTARRVGVNHFRGAAELAYEADAVVVMNEKLAIVSRSHVAYSPLRVEEFSRQVVFSIEKNRGGVSGVDLEFTKNFPQFRFDPHGSWVAENLWTEHGIGD